MSKPKPLAASKLYRACRASDFTFTTTKNLPSLDSTASLKGAVVANDNFIGQERVVEALRFATRVKRKGYNIFAVGENGLGKRTLVLRFLRQQAANLPAPADWMYLHDFENPRRPWAVSLPCGLGKVFKTDLQEFILDLKQAIPAAFDNEGFFERSEKIKDTAAQEQADALKDLALEAEPLNLKLVLQSPGGYMFVPADAEGNPLDAEVFAQLPDAERQIIRTHIETMETKLRGVLRQLTHLEKQSRLEQQALNEEVTNSVLVDGLQALQEKYASFPRILDYLQALHKDLLDNLAIFLTNDEDDEDAIASVSPDKRIPTRYQVNLISSQAGQDTAPVVEEALPTHNNLVGHIENVTYQGTVATDFSLIRPGALHRANGGFLVLQAERVLTQPYAWEGLKLALRTGCLRIDSLERQLSVSGSVSLEPEAVPLNCTVALLGDYEVLNALYEQDPEFAELFKVVAEFETEMPRTLANQSLYANLIASMVNSEELLPVSKQGVMRLVEEAARNAEHQDKISLNASELNHLLREADYLASSLNKEVIDAQAVEAALAVRRKRGGRYPEQVLESITEDFIIISTSGERIGQVNGLTLVSGHDFYHGQPSRITARVHYGSGEVLDIERSVNLGGAMHSKGVMILSSFLTSQFAVEDSLPLDASLVFEQSYANVDGDSASLAELLCLLSAMAEVPAKQDLAITGSVNQLGEVQPIGGVNEKIEGFFAVCQARGFNGQQGVIIPWQNIKQLMLRPEVIAAVKNKQFHIWGVKQVDEAIPLLLGLSAQKLYAKINQRLETLRDKDDEEENNNKEDKSGAAKQSAPAKKVATSASAEEQASLEEQA